MRRTRHGIELQRGNIKVTVSEETAREGITQMRKDDAQREEWREKAAWDPEGYVSRPGAHAYKGKRYAEPWRGSGATTRESTKVSYLPTKNEHGLTVQPGLTIDDYLRHLNG